ncbi:hypothetical protein EVAR_63096_1 [Eumeta japonica]|uniref:Uncharacterized protein n=1 Tax=Eumeta variegata TaxID=151549 RepID=A0A4C2A142_EUMVA|nr:hypothetical protein EVAR_63096_1 [Eumeta japonica]
MVHCLRALTLNDEANSFNPGHRYLQNVSKAYIPKPQPIRVHFHYYTAAMIGFLLLQCVKEIDPLSRKRSLKKTRRTYRLGTNAGAVSREPGINAKRHVLGGSGGR